MNIVNLTPHTVNYEGRAFHSQGFIRVSEIIEEAGQINGMRLCNVKYGSIISDVDLDESGNTKYIVSGMVLEAARGTKYASLFMSPVQLVRDSKGNVTGCKAFRILA